VRAGVLDPARAWRTLAKFSPGAERFTLWRPPGRQGAGLAAVLSCCNGPDSEPTLAEVLDQLVKREPIFHRPEFGATRADFENWRSATKAPSRRCGRPRISSAEGWPEASTC